MQVQTWGNVNSRYAAVVKKTQAEAQLDGNKYFEGIFGVRKQHSHETYMDHKIIARKTNRPTRGKCKGLKVRRLQLRKDWSRMRSFKKNSWQYVG